MTTKRGEAAAIVPSESICRCTKPSYPWFR